MILLSALHDPTGIFEKHIVELPTDFYNLFTAVYILHTDMTSPKTLRSFNSKVELQIGGTYSDSKVLGLKEAYGKFPHDSFFYCDFDKVLLWNKKYSTEFKTVVNRPLETNYLILGRSKKTFETYPNSWIETESITNVILSKQLGLTVDALTATCLFDAHAAKVITKNATGKEWESPVEWPLLVKQANLTISYEHAEGLEWEDPYFYFDNSQFSFQSEWQETIYNSPKEWTKRLAASTQQVAKLTELLIKN